jgi:hypothetical protein
MKQNSSTTQAAPVGIAPLVNIAVAERAITRATGRALHQPGMVGMYGPSGYGKSLAAAWVTARNRAYYVQASDFWTKKVMMQDICRALGLQFNTGHTIADMARMIAAQLEQSARPLIVDEFDYVIDKNLVEALRSIYEASKAAILIIGEEAMPQKLKRWERFHGRILDWYPAQPAGLEDARELAKLYCPHVAVSDCLLEKLVDKARGSVRRISTNLETIQEEAMGNAWERVTLEMWGTRMIHTGEAPRRA